MPHTDLVRNTRGQACRTVFVLTVHRMPCHHAECSASRTELSANGIPSNSVCADHGRSRPGDALSRFQSPCCRATVGSVLGLVVTDGPNMGRVASALISKQSRMLDPDDASSSAGDSVGASQPRKVAGELVHGARSSSSDAPVQPWGLCTSQHSATSTIAGQ